MMKLLCVLSFTLLLTACKTTPLTIHYQVTPVLNLSAEHKALPLYTKLYQLQTSDQFLDIGLRELWRDDQNVLGKSFISHNELTLQPGQTVKQSISLSRDANVICIAGFYRKPWKKQWRDCHPLGQINRFVKNNLTVNVGTDGIKFIRK